MTYKGTRTFENQNTMFHEVVWDSEESYTLSSSGLGHSQYGAPAGVTASASLKTETTRPPYWEFDWIVNASSGLLLSNIKVRHTQSSGSSEPVFESLGFADLEVTFTDGSRVTFDIAAGLADSRSSLKTTENGSWPGTSPPDLMYQRGIHLRLFANVLATIGGQCDVTLDMTVVFRGAANDFDPGGVPVAMIMWPQVSWKWNNIGASKTVKEFRASVVPVMENTMYGMPHSNLSSLFTDSNTSAKSLARSNVFGLRAVGGYLMGLPFGWGMTFDYATPNIAREREITGVYGPDDGNKFSGASPRRRTYTYHGSAPITLGAHVIEVDKAHRQGDFDNIHTHARMMAADTCGNEQVHAPFCGHSCVHQHWRWSNIASNGALGGRGWQYRGWSSASPRSKSKPFGTNDAPLIPPNQRLNFAILAPGSVRHSRSHIVNPSSPKLLPADRKKYWHTVDIIDPPANQNQVIFEHGIGWAYRYSLPSECPPLQDMARKAIISWTIGFGSPTQTEVAAYFADKVYPTWRYMTTSSINFTHCDPQVPTGSYDQVHSGGSNIAMEDL